MVPYRGLAFDRDLHLVDVGSQEKICGALRALGISFISLKGQLVTEESESLVGEYVTLRREQLYRRTSPLLAQIETVVNNEDATGLLRPQFYEVMVTAFDELSQSLGTAGQSWAMGSSGRALERLQRFPRGSHSDESRRRGQTATVSTRSLERSSSDSCRRCAVARVRRSRRP